MEKTNRKEENKCWLIGDIKDNEKEEDEEESVPIWSRYYSYKCSVYFKKFKRILIAKEPRFNNV